SIEYPTNFNFQSAPPVPATTAAGPAILSFALGLHDRSVKGQSTWAVLTRTRFWRGTSFKEDGCAGQRGACPAHDGLPRPLDAAPMGLRADERRGFLGSSRHVAHACMLAASPNGRFDPMKEALMSAQPRKVVHPDIKPENTPELASRYLDVPNMKWEPTKFAGIRIKVLYSDDSGITTAPFKLDPGAVVPLHEHTALEQTFVLEGTLEDHEGVCGPGQF